jgi:hypothetical protein
VTGVTSDALLGVGTDRFGERRRAVALARHYRAFEGLSIRVIAGSPRPLAGHGEGVLLRPGENARAVSARCQGLCRGCGAYTQPQNGKGDAYAYCKACQPCAIELWRGSSWGR